MSDIYNSYPPTGGKVILNTNYGSIEIELFTKECPLACRNFIQLCLEGYYNNKAFHRIINDFMIQAGGDEPTIYDKDFKDEFHSRIKFKIKGLVACVNKNKANSNTNQFFITVIPCPWLDNKNTIFGRIIGNSFFNIKAISDLKSENGELLIVKSGHPVILSSKVLINPFDDIVVRNLYKNNNLTVERFNLENRKIINNSNLLSFDEEDKETNQIQVNKKLLSKKRKLIISKGISDIQEEKDKSEINPIENCKNTSLASINYNNETTVINNNAINCDTIIPNVTEIKEISKKSKLSQLRNKFISQNSSNVKNINNITNLKHKDIVEKVKLNDNWMANKLTFHVDSDKAYLIDKVKQVDNK